MTKRSPIYFFSERAAGWKRIESRLRSGGQLALFLDYDGTLTAIRKTPDKAILSRTAHRVLKELARMETIRLTIVTGRSMSSIRKLVRTGDIAYAANHGFHILLDGKEWIHPGIAVFSGLLSGLHREIRTVLERYPGAIIEDKKMTLSVHYRNLRNALVPSLRRNVHAVVRSFDPTLVITHGKKVMEIRPPVPWDKGRAVLMMLRERAVFRKPLVVYAGDDATDEDAFRSLRNSAITIKVGRERPTHARYYLKDTAEVLRFLRCLLTAGDSADNS